MRESKPVEGYCEGEVCQELKKTIHTLIIATPTYVVFLDDEFFVQWAELGEVEYAKNYSEVMNRVSYLETISATHFSGLPTDKGELLEFRRLLGESVARLYDGDGTSASAILDQAAQLLVDRSIQRARQWYLTAAALTAGLPLLGAGVLWLFRYYFRLWLGLDGFDVVFCAFLGGVGALISTIIRVRQVNLNSSSGPILHYIEGMARITVGMIGGALVTLAVKGDIILGVVNSPNHDGSGFAFLTCIALISGASERIVPNLITQIEARASAAES